jgi:p-cumate 2,3-dioxygenase beta subunit
MGNEQSLLRERLAGLRAAVEDFLYYEAALLDEWRLDDWLALFTADAQYVVPTTDLPEGDPRHHLVFIDDDLGRLRGRVTRLKSRHAHREYPWSRTRRLITNIRVLNATDDGEVAVTASFAVYRFRAGQEGSFIGRYDYTLVQGPDGFKIRYRRATLDHESLQEHGAISILL